MLVRRHALGTRLSCFADRSLDNESSLIGCNTPLSWLLQDLFAFKFWSTQPDFWREKLLLTRICKKVKRARVSPADTIELKSQRVPHMCQEMERYVTAGLSGL